MTGQPDLSIIIVNWNSAAFVRRCLSSIYANSGAMTVEILVVDNASFDGCDELVQNEFPAVRFIQNPENQGFARANNLGFSHASGRNLLFLNPDTEVVGPALETLLSVLQATPDVGIVGARLLNSDGSIQTSCIQRFPTILNQALDIEWLHLRYPKCPLWNIGPLFEGSESPVSVDAVSGACLMIERGVFEEVGQFTTDYFMYAEDVDLCWKVKRLGRNNYYVGRAEVVHHGGQSTLAKPESNFSNVMMRESSLKFLLASRGRAYAGAYRFTTALAAVVRLAMTGAALLLTAGRFRRLVLARALSKWTAILRWALGVTPLSGSKERAARDTTLGIAE